MVADLAQRHGHGWREHSHPHGGAHRHLSHGLPLSSSPAGERETRLRPGHRHPGGGGHDHAHGLVMPSVVRSRAGLRAVGLSLLILGATAVAQAVVYVVTGSVALLADLVHNGGDALTALPLGIAFWRRSARAERLAGLAVVGAIFVSACVAAVESVMRLVHPEPIAHLGALAAAG